MRISDWSSDVCSSDLLGIGRQEGATALSGGEQLTGEGYAGGYFVAPTVFGGVRDDMTIAKEEIFGPVISAIPFTDIDEVLSRANATTFGLGRGVWTRAVNTAEDRKSVVEGKSVS